MLQVGELIFQDIDLVINYDVALNSKIHTHRVGRTARAGKRWSCYYFL